MDEAINMERSQRQRRAPDRWMFASEEGKNQNDFSAAQPPNFNPEAENSKWTL